MLARVAPRALLFALALAGPVLAAAEGEDRDLEALGRSLASYALARDAGLGLEEARSAVLEALEVVRRAKDGRDPLLASEDLGRALLLGRSIERRLPRMGKVTTETFEHGSFQGGGMEFAYRVPKDYDPRERSYPLVVAIPEEDESAAEHIRSHWSLDGLGDELILVSPTMPEDVETWDRVMLHGRPAGLSYVLTAVRFATSRFAVDPNRVFVAGRGAGVAAALAAGDTSPHRFAGVLGRTGDAGDLPPVNLGNLAIAFFEGGEKARAFVADANEAGNDRVTLESGDDPAEILAWLLTNERHSAPLRVTVATGKPFPTHAYWLRVAPSTPRAWARGSIDREKNLVRIESDGVAAVTLMLNDQLVDLTRPLRVLCNDVEHSLTPEPRVDVLLDLLQDGTCDAGRVYVTRDVFDLSGTVAPPAPGADPRLDEPFLAQFQAAEDADSLWALHQWCLGSQRRAASELTLAKLLRLTPDHPAARAALGFHGAPGRWFESAEAMARFEASQVPEVASAKGHVEVQGTWMHPDDRGHASKDWSRDGVTGLWLLPADERRLAKGWARQDFEWIEPEEVS